MVRRGADSCAATNGGVPVATHYVRRARLDELRDADPLAPAAARSTARANLCVRALDAIIGPPYPDGDRLARGVRDLARGRRPAAQRRRGDLRPRPTPRRWRGCPLAPAVPVITSLSRAGHRERGQSMLAWTCPAAGLPVRVEPFPSASTRACQLPLGRRHVGPDSRTPAASSTETTTLTSHSSPTVHLVELHVMPSRCATTVLTRFRLLLHRPAMCSPPPVCQRHSFYRARSGPRRA